MLQDLGDPAGAPEPLAERALAINEAAYGPDHPDVATRLSNLATVLRDLGDPAGDAEPLTDRALRHRPKPPTAPTTPPSPSG